MQSVLGCFPRPPCQNKEVCGCPTPPTLMIKPKSWLSVVDVVVGKPVRRSLMASTSKQHKPYRYRDTQLQQTYTSGANVFPLVFWRFASQLGAHGHQARNKIANVKADRHRRGGSGAMHETIVLSVSRCSSSFQMLTVVS